MKVPKYKTVKPPQNETKTVTTCFHALLVLPPFCVAFCCCSLVVPPVVTLFLACSWVVPPVPGLFLGCSGCSWVALECSVF